MRRSVTLAATQMIDVSRVPGRGNWVYIVRATTKAFSEGGIAYKQAVAPGYANVATDVAECPGSPLCGKSQ